MWLEDELVRLRTQQKKVGTTIEKDLEERLKKLEKRNNGYMEMRADGEMTKEEYMQKRTEMMSEIEKVEKELEEIRGTDFNLEDEIEITIDIMSRLQDK